MKKFVLVVLMVLCSSTLHAAWDGSLQYALDDCRDAIQLMQPQITVTGGMFTFSTSAYSYATLSQIYNDTTAAFWEIYDFSNINTFDFSANYELSMINSTFYYYFYVTGIDVDIARMKSLTETAIEKLSNAIVSLLYHDIFNHPPDAGGASYWASTLINGQNTVDSVAYYLSIARANELYSTYLHRSPDQGELAFWLTMLTTQTMNGAQVETSIRQTARQ